MELEAFFAAAQDEIEKRDQAILELADALDMMTVNMTLDQLCP